MDGSARTLSLIVSSSIWQLTELTDIDLGSLKDRKAYSATKC